MSAKQKRNFVLPSILMGLSLTIASLAFASKDAMTSTMSPKGAEVYIISPKDGEVVTSPFEVKFGLKGMGVAPAGVEKKNTGHHHILIDAKLANMKLPIPSDKNHKHFGGGQTQTSLKLAKGKHTLQLVLGDKNHIPHHPSVASKVIRITVK